MRTTRTPVVLCPKCGHTLNAASSIYDPEARPSPGDCTICIECASILLFDFQLRPVLANAAELASMREDPEAWDDVSRTVAAVKAMHCAIGKPSEGRLKDRPN